MKVTQSCPHELYNSWNSPGQDTGVGSLSFLQGIFPTQESNPGLPHCRWILYQLSHQGSPRILEWIPIPSPVDLLIQELNQGLLHCRCILYQLSYQGSLQAPWGTHKQMKKQNQVESIYRVLTPQNLINI